MTYRDGLADDAQVQPLDVVISQSLETAEEATLTACENISQKGDDLGYDAGYNCERGLLVVDVFSCSALGTDLPCDPAAIEVSPGVMGRLVPPPPIPDGFRPISAFIEFAALTDQPTTIVMPSTEAVEEDDHPAFYTFVDGEWIRLASAKLTDGRGLMEADFEKVPDNIIVFVPDVAEA